MGSLYYLLVLICINGVLSPMFGMLKFNLDNNLKGVPADMLRGAWVQSTCYAVLFLLIERPGMFIIP